MGHFLRLDSWDKIRLYKTLIKLLACINCTTDILVSSFLKSGQGYTLLSSLDLQCLYPDTMQTVPGTIIVYIALK